MSRRVLFLYPNINTELRIPLAISILTACIRKAGHEVRLFDTTFMVEKFETDDEAMVKLGTHLTTNINELVGQLEAVDIKKKLEKTINEFKPDLVAVSLLERNFPAAKELCAFIKKEFSGLKILVGGIMPTIAPGMVFAEGWLDMIVVGEGEGAIVDILNNFDNVPVLKTTPNLWLKTREGAVYKNPMRPLVRMDDVPEQDWSDFDKRHMLKPFMGKVYVGGPFEFSRGCLKACTFCVAPELRMMQKGAGKYHRTKSASGMIREIENKARQLNITMISFGDTDFLSGVPKSVMVDFLEQYRDKIHLPFTIQSGAETLIDESILEILREAGCVAVSVGVESGSDRIRKTVLKKFVPKTTIKRAFDLCRKHGVRITANYMVGVPDETELDIRESIEFNRLIDPPSIAVTFFTPFVGTELYKISVEKGYYQPFNIGSNSYKTSPLNMPQLPPGKIYSLVEEFVADFKKYQNEMPPLIA